MKIKYVGSLIIVILLVATMLCSCVAPAPAPTPAPTPAPAPAPAPAGPVKIGSVLGLTGFMATDAGGVLKGIQFKLDEVGYKVAGRDIEFISEDGASDVTVYVDKARKLVENDKVDVILGPLFSAAGFAVAEYLQKSRTPNITAHVSPIGLIEGPGGNVFLVGTLLGEGYPLGTYAYEQLGYRTASIIRPDNVTGEELTGGFAHGFVKKGGTIVQEQIWPENTMDFSPYLTTVKKADCVVFWGHAPFVAPFLTQYQSAGLKIPILMPLTGPAKEVILKDIGDVSLGMIGSENYYPLIDTNINKQFVDAFYKKYQIYPAAEDAGGYIAATMFLEAVKAANGDTSHDAIINALHKIKVDTPAGMRSYDEKGLARGNLYIAKVVKLGDRYAWEPIFAYEDIIMDEPK